MIYARYCEICVVAAVRPNSEFACANGVNTYQGNLWVSYPPKRVPGTVYLGIIWLGGRVIQVTKGLTSLTRLKMAKYIMESCGTLGYLSRSPLNDVRINGERKNGHGTTCYTCKRLDSCSSE